MWDIRTAGRMLAAAAVVVVATVPILAAGSAAQDGQQAQFDGRDVFRTYCVVCHGQSAKGDGPLASSLKKPPADLTQFSKKNNGTFPRDMVLQIIDGREPVAGHGGGDMPVWGDAFSRATENADPESVKARIKALVDYIESIQQK
jgi:mono/diheme cytochrome c family protein